MPVDPKFIGKTYDPVVYKVGREKIREYALAVNDKNKHYLDLDFARSTPYGNLVAPPMMAVVYAKGMLEKVLFDNELKLNLPMLVHGGQEFTFHKVVLAEDEITTTGKIAHVENKTKPDGKPGNTIVVMATESHNQNGELVSEGKWTFVVRG